MVKVDASKNDPFGRELTQDIAAIFQRQQEERVQPVGKDDVAGVLRRRLFTPYSIPKPPQLLAIPVPMPKSLCIPTV